MGNGASCVPLSIGKAAAAAAMARVVGPDGALRLIQAPAGAAEIMLEFPGHVVARADEAARSRRAAGMRADEDLLPGAAYLVLPLDRVGSRLSDRQLEALIAAAAGGRSRGKRRSEKGPASVKRVFPEAAAGGEEGNATGGGFPCKRVGGCRQWRPALDTIHESKSK